MRQAFQRQNSRRPAPTTRCPVGLSRNEENVTCRSCIRQRGDLAANCLGKVKGKKKEDIASVLVWWENQTLVTTAKLPTANTWHGRPIHVYQAEKRKWRKVFAGAERIWGTADGLRRLHVIRYVKYEHHMTKDEDNRIASIKPLKDVLVEIGVLTDDTDDDVAFKVEQRLGDPRVEITIGGFL